MSPQLERYDILMKVLEIIEQEQSGYLNREQANVFVEKFFGHLCNTAVCCLGFAECSDPVDYQNNTGLRIIHGKGFNYSPDRCVE